MVLDDHLSELTEVYNAGLREWRRAYVGDDMVRVANATARMIDWWRVVSAAFTDIVGAVIMHPDAAPCELCPHSPAAVAAADAASINA
jgi:hypothetical protein